MFKEKAALIIRKFQRNEDGDNKKKIENLVVFIIVLIVTIVLINYIWNGDKKTKSDSNSNTKVLSEEKIEIVTDEDSMERKLESILSKVKGVGEVKVLITYSKTSETMPMYSENISQTTTEENDSRRWY